MSTTLKEWLVKTITELEEERDAVPGAVNEDAANALAAMKLALASLEAKSKLSNFIATQESLGVAFERVLAENIEELYVPSKSTPPAPVSDSLLSELLGIAKRAADEADECAHAEFSDDSMKHLAAIGDWERRAAMLQGADRPQNEPQNIPENIPATQFKPVADLYGLTSPTGGETSFTFDAVEARDFIDGGWSCQEYVELGRFQEAMLQNGNSPAQSDCCPEQNYIAPAQDGDSPVIPDGWVLVPEEPTHEMLEAGDEQFGTYDVYRRMIAASPQQK
ncbi:hypothetical protein M8T34_05400 [Enterobacter hormaechei]|uniref:hypothetical protein n=1 Tax=Enterobacter hormaechei TaxID=158836 RepID=UPI0020213F56|nr:hypothetical protein [Enterobacter hormaechei]MCL8098532.1 hypothetical protein [Enterobacter hormaechei]MCM8025479.1 hypothetical protein [Enterobacter hormaechei]MCM8047194.1 hypothetical protein [Enterobacter hormaechei]